MKHMTSGLRKTNWFWFTRQNQILTTVYYADKNKSAENVTFSDNATNSRQYLCHIKTRQWNSSTLGVIGVVVSRAKRRPRTADQRATEHPKQHERVARTCDGLQGNTLLSDMFRAHMLAVLPTLEKLWFWGKPEVVFCYLTRRHKKH